MQKVIEFLEEIKEGIINAYEEKTHLSRAKIAKMMDDETWLNAKKAKQLGFVDGILFSKKEDAPQTEPDEDENKDEPDESDNPDTIETTPDEDESKQEKPRKAPDSMIYSPSKTAASLMQKISAMTPKGVPIDQFDKRLALLKN